MKKKNNTYFIDSSLSDYDYLVLDNLSNLNEEHDKTFKENEKVSDSVYFHGSVEDIKGYLNKPINWITKDFDYAKTFALGNGYVYECSANLGNLLDVGKTDNRVFDLIPSTPLKFSREFTAIIRKLNVSEDSIRRIIDNVADEYKVNQYRLAIRPVVRSMAFKRILEGLGFDGIRAIEYDSINNKNVETFGLFDQVKVLGKVNESLDESLKEIEQTGILISSSLYEIKDKILNSKKPLKLVGAIVNDEETWLIGNPYGDTHEDMLQYAEQYGYLSENYGKKNNVYLNTVPYNKKINVFVDYSEGMEYDYDNTRIVDVTNGHNYGNTNSFENTKLFKVLGEPNESKKYLYKDHINEYLDEDIEDNKSLEDKFYRWQVGGEDFNNIFSDEDVKYMRSHLTTVTTPVYRCEMLSDNNNRNLDVGDTITFDRLRSFSKSKEGFYDVMFMWDDVVESEDDDVICFKTQGPVKVFDVENEFNLDYSKAFDDFGSTLNTQAEIFVEGTFKVVKKGTIYDDYLETKHVLLTLEQIDSNFEESLEEEKAITWGDLDVAKKTDTRKMMGGRGTGHFGTGFYFVGKEGPYGLDGDGNFKNYDYEPSRPIYEIDLDKYNLYRPKDNDSAYRLHDAMASINNYYSPDMNKYLFSNIDTDALMNNFYDVVANLDEDVDDDDFDDLDFDIDDIEDTEEDDVEKDSTKDNSKYIDVAKSWIEKYDLADWINTGYDDLDTWLDKNKNKLGLIEKSVEDAINNRDKYLGYVEYAIDVLCKVFNTNRNTLIAMCKAFYNMKSEDTISTLLFKEFGYEGVDVTHLNHDAQGLSGLDNFGYGTVIYDLKPGTFKKIKEPRRGGSIHAKAGESLTEDAKDTTTVYTYQSPEVLKQLQNGETYIASYERGMLSNDSYKELARVLGLNNCPIFGGLSEEDTEDMTNSSGLDVDDKVLLTLEVPTSEVHKMGYYDWTDYIYYYIDGQEEPEWSREEFENILRNYSGDTPCQVVIDRIEPEWLVNSEDVSITSNYDEDDIDIVDNTKSLLIVTKQNQGYYVSVSEIDNSKNYDWDNLSKESIINLITKYSNAQPSSSYPFSDIAKVGIADIIKKGNGWLHPRKFGTKSINEYFDEIPDEGESYKGYTTVNDCPIYATDETYKIKSMLENSSVPYRLLLTQNGMFLVQDARGNKTHYDMALKAAQEGYYDDDSDWYDDESYMVFFPSNFEGEIRWHTTLGEDSYYSCRVYPIGVIFVRDSYAYNNKLFDALGNPEREIYYDEEDDKVTIIKNGERIVLDVHSDLNGEPNNAITQQVEA